MNESMLIAAMSRLDEDKVMAMVEIGLENGVPPLEIIENVRQGMAMIGQLYEQGEYFLSDLMMSAEIFKCVTEFLKRKGSIYEPITAPPIIIGTVKNDIHDIGKNIMVQLLQCKGFKVIDLGVDVSPGAFVQAVAENPTKVVCMSGLLTSSYESMRLTVQELSAKDLRDGIKILIGGLVNEQVRQFVRADYWIKDSTDGLYLCQSILLPKEQAMIS